MTREQQIAEFLARKGATVCPPTGEAFTAKPLHSMRRERERNLTNPALDAEQAAEVEREVFARAKAAGFTVSDALDEARDAVLNCRA